MTTEPVLFIPETTRKELHQAYNDAVKTGKETFKFTFTYKQNVELDTNYTKYLLEHLDNQEIPK